MSGVCQAVCERASERFPRPWPFSLARSYETHERSVASVQPRGKETKRNEGDRNNGWQAGNKTIPRSSMNGIVAWFSLHRRKPPKQVSRKTDCVSTPTRHSCPITRPCVHANARIYARKFTTVVNRRTYVRVYATILKIANDRGHKTALRRDANVKTRGVVKMLESVLKTRSTLRRCFRC